MIDEFQGQGGSYILDPETGIRTLVKRTLPPVPQEVISNAPSNSEAPDPSGDGIDVRDGSDSDRRRRRSGSRSEYHSSAE